MTFEEKLILQRERSLARAEQYVRRFPSRQDRNPLVADENVWLTYLLTPTPTEPKDS